MEGSVSDKLVGTDVGASYDMGGQCVPRKAGTPRFAANKLEIRWAGGGGPPGNVQILKIPYRWVRRPVWAIPVVQPYRWV